MTLGQQESCWRDILFQLNYQPRQLPRFPASCRGLLIQTQGHAKLWISARYSDSSLLKPGRCSGNFARRRPKFDVPDHENCCSQHQLFCLTHGYCTPSKLVDKCGQCAPNTTATSATGARLFSNVQIRDLIAFLQHQCIYAQEQPLMQVISGIAL